MQRAGWGPRPPRAVRPRPERVSRSLRMRNLPFSRLLSPVGRLRLAPMGLPRETVPLQPSQIAELDRVLSEVRHNVNNHLALMVAALELIRRKPDAVPRVLDNIVEQPQ